MENKYKINLVRICPFIFIGKLNIIPNLNYPARLCVVSEEEGFAIDIETNLKYDYIESPSRLYIQSMVDKIKDEKRVALPVGLYSNDVKYEYKKGKKIIQELKLGKKFKNGNEVFNNEQYLEYINQKNEMKNNNEKVKKIGKRRK